jgi:sugar phosphate isomerase/epimerase
MPAFVHLSLADESTTAVQQLFARENLIAWCIVPFDALHRGPQERAVMLKELGFTKFAYDWRAEHLPSFEEELGVLKRHKIELTAVWFPPQLNAEARQILETLKRNNVRTQLWVTMADPAPGSPDQGEDAQNQTAAKLAAAVKALRPIVVAAAAQECKVGLYNHGGWFGEPENQVAIVKALDAANVGIVYNLHHGHDHVGRFAEILARLKPHLLAINLNGMDRDGERLGRKILPLGQGELDLELLRAIADSGYRSPVGILGHTQDDAKLRLQDNLDGLAWLVEQLDGGNPGPSPTPRTPLPERRRGHGPDAAKRPNRVVPTHADVRYGPHERNVLDLYLAKSRQPTPLVLYIHGGGFRGGDKRSLKGSRPRSFLNAGYSVAAINYRLTDAAPAPAAYLDCGRALQFLRHHAGKWNLDPKLVASTGGSAGAGTSMWLAFHDDLAEPYSDDPIARQSTRVTCIAVSNGQSSYDPRFLKNLGIPRPNLERHPFFLPFYGITEDEIDTPKAYRRYDEMAPITHLSEGDPPALLDYSYPNIAVDSKTNTNLVVHHPMFGIALQERMDRLGIQCIVQYVDRSGRKVRHKDDAPTVSPVEFIRICFQRTKSTDDH